MIEELDHTVASLLEDAKRLGHESAEPQPVQPGLYIHHKDMQISDLTAIEQKLEKRYNKGPENPSGLIRCHTPETLAHAYHQYRDDRTQVFADIEDRIILCVFDYLEPNANPAQTEEEPGKYLGRTTGWRQHLASLRFQPSQQLQEWEALAQWTPQLDFAEFIEDHLPDIAEPDGQSLLQLARDLEATSTGEFKSRLNLENDTIALKFVEDTTTSVEVPRQLTLAIPLFEHGDRYRITARFRFSARDGRLKFRVLLTNLRDAQQQEFERITQQLEETIGQPIYRGSVEL